MSENILNSTVIEMRDAAISTLRDSSLTVVENVNWSVASGEFWVVAGQQQSGKSDLLMTAAGLLLPSRGSCRVFGCETDSFSEAQLAEGPREPLVPAAEEEKEEGAAVWRRGNDGEEETGVAHSRRPTWDISLGRTPMADTVGDGAALR